MFDYYYDFFYRFFWLFALVSLVILFLSLLGVIVDKEECKNINVNCCCERKCIKNGS